MMLELQMIPLFMLFVSGQDIIEKFKGWGEKTSCVCVCVVQDAASGYEMLVRFGEESQVLKNRMIYIFFWSLTAMEQGQRD